MALQIFKQSLGGGKYKAMFLDPSGASRDITDYGDMSALPEFTGRVNTSAGNVNLAGAQKLFTDYETEQQRVAGQETEQQMIGARNKLVEQYGLGSIAGFTNQYSDPNSLINQYSKAGKTTLTPEELTAVKGGQAPAFQFRPRGQGEDMYSYLQAKQQAEKAATDKSSIELGKSPAELAALNVREPISTTEYYKDGKEINPANFTNLKPGTTDFDNYLKEQGITTKAPVISSAVDLTKPKTDIAATEKSVEMNKSLGRIQKAYDVFIAQKLNPNQVKIVGASGEDFIKQASQASKGRLPTAEELVQLKKGTVGDVLAFYGLTEKMSDGGIMSMANASGGVAGTTGSTAQPDTTIASETDPRIIDLQKFETKLNDDLKLIQDRETAAKTALANFETSYGLGQQKIEDQPIPMQAIIGQQTSLQRTAAIQEKNLIAKLGIVQEEKAGIIDRANLQMQIEDKIYTRKQDIIKQAQAYRDDQQQALATFLSLAKESGIAKDTYSPETLSWINSIAKSIGMDSGFIINALDTIYTDKLRDDILKAQPKTPSSYDEWVLAGKPGTYADWVQNKGDIKIVKISGQDYIQNSDGTFSLPDVPQIYKEATELQKQAGFSAQSLLDKFISGEGTSAIGKSRIFGAQLIPGTAAKNFEIDFNTLKSQLSLDAVKYLKGQGQVSDAERRLLAEATTKLNLNQTESEFESTLQDIVTTLGNPGGLQVKDDGNYIYKNLDGSIHRGKQGDNYIDKTLPTNIDLSEISFSGGINSATILKKLASMPNETIGGQCGEFVNNITKIGVGDSYQSKISKMDKAIKNPEPGMIFTIPYKNTGHIGFIVGIAGDKVIVKDSNFYTNSAPNQIAIHTIPISSITGLRRV